MAEKKYKLSAGANEDLVAKMGYCLASDKITVDGLPVGYMYREEPEEEDDSGWRFCQEQKNKIMSTILRIQVFMMSIQLPIMTRRSFTI